MEEAWQAIVKEFPKFDRVNPRSWIARAEEIFEVDHLSEREKMQLAFLSMEGVATHWFYSCCYHTPDLTWNSFVTLLLQHYQRLERLINLRQSSTLDAYVQEYEALVAPLPNLSQEWLLARFLLGLELRVRLRLRSVRPTNVLRAIEIARVVDEEFRRLAAVQPLSQEVLDFQENQMQPRKFFLTPKNQVEENQVPPRKFFLTPKNQVKDLTGSGFPSHENSTVPDPIYVSLSSDDENDLPNDDDASKQLVLYDPASNENNKIELVPDPLSCEPPRLLDLLPRTKPSNSAPRLLPSVGAFTVQCASCFKWRLIPTKEKYEEIREHILEEPFVCQSAREWRPDISCDDPEDISQDGNRIWAIDKPNIAQPPDGWQRLLRIRSEGSSKFADVYYVAPTGKRLRSRVEIQKFLTDHPEYMRDGVTLSRFSFTTPKPLQENYVRKRPSYKLNGPVEPQQVTPLAIAWAGPEDSANSDEERPELPAPYMGLHVSDTLSRPTKKRTVHRQSPFRDDAP